MSDIMRSVSGGILYVLGFPRVPPVLIAGIVMMIGISAGMRLAGAF